MPFMAAPRPCTQIKWINLKCIPSIIEDITLQSQARGGEGRDKMRGREGERSWTKGGKHTHEVGEGIMTAKGGGTL